MIDSAAQSKQTRRARRQLRAHQRRVLRDAPPCVVRDCRGEGKHYWAWFNGDEDDAPMTHVHVCARHYDDVADDIGDHQQEPLLGGPIPRGNW